MSLPILPTYIPVAEAAEKYGYDLDELKKMARSGKINAAVLPDGDMVVSDASIKAKILKKEDLPEYKKFADLKDKEVWVSQAARDYEVPAPTISTWVKAGFIKVVGMDRNRKMLKAQDVAYCAKIYHRYKELGTQGRRIFDEKGMPYKAKTGELAMPDGKSESKALTIPIETKKEELVQETA